MKIYTGSGDDGTTSLRGGKRVEKFNNRIEASGSVDELISWIGLLRGCVENRGRQDFLIYIQTQLMSVTAALAHDYSNNDLAPVLPDPGCVRRVEEEIDCIEKHLIPLSSFILPGGSEAVSFCHIARCVCRRAERNVVRLGSGEPVPAIVTGLLNRLSDYLFVLARELASESDNEDVK